MNKKYTVKLTKDERTTIFITINDEKTPKTIRNRCNILLLADTSTGKPLTQKEITTKYQISDICVYKTIKNYHQHGLEYTLRRRTHKTPPRKPIVNGEDEARIVALACSKPPKGYARWSLRLLTKNIIELQIMPAIGRETVRKTLKKQNINLT
ncbi:MAG: helix-turn-helix domain-containing protein [Candidatus Bathyarchaeota archaeon]|nr:helix-turn-helix domain-containing protein [Candidatus Termiticorpusculum sp.]